MRSRDSLLKSAAVTFAFVSVFLLLGTIPATAKEPFRLIEGLVVKIADGDTVTVNSADGKVKVRLYGIDAPEVQRVNRRTGIVSKDGQPIGEEAQRALTSKVLRQRVRVDVLDTDRYRRLVGVLWKDGRNINEEMVFEGWAWAYRQYLDRPHRSEYIALEEDARRQRRGVWKQSNPVPPWEFRRLQRIR